MATMMAMTIVNQFRGTIKSHRKRRLEEHFVENEHPKRAATAEIQSTPSKSENFDNASSNSSSSSIASLDLLPLNEFLQSDELKASTNMTYNDKEITETINSSLNSSSSFTTSLDPLLPNQFLQNDELKASTDMTYNDKEITETINSSSNSSSSPTTSLNLLLPNEFLQSDELKASTDMTYNDKEITETINSSSNSSSSSTTSLDPLLPNEFLQSDELKASTDMTYNDKEITETNNSSSNSSESSTTSLDLLLPNEFLQSDELKASIDMTCNDKEITETNNCLNTVVEPKEVPFYVPKAHSRFISHVNKLEELNGLKFIGVVSGLKADDNPYLWYQTDNPNSTHHKEFSYSVLRLDKFPKTNVQLKNNQDRWISLILHISEMTEEETENIFDDEPVFQEVLQILKLDNLTSDKRREYLHSEKIRRSKEESNRSKFEKGQKIGLEIYQEILREIGRDISRKMNLEIKRRKSINETIVIKEIIGPIVDEHFDQGLLKMNTEKYKPIVMDILERYKSSIRYDTINFQEKWSDERIENFKENLSKKVENQIARLPRLEPENELQTKEKLVQKTSNEFTEIKSIEEYNSTVRPPRE
jgi:hypothetical protein